MKKILTTLFVLLPLLAPAQRKYNTDESKVGPYTLENPLEFVDGTPVKSLKDWKRRRKEILDIFQKEMYGQMPPKSEIYLDEFEQGPTLAGFGLRKQVKMYFREDKTGPSITWLMVLPAKAKGPVPAIITLNYQGNHTLLKDPEVVIPDAWLKNSEENEITENKPVESRRGYFDSQYDRNVYPIAMILARGYAFVTACFGDISPDPVGREAQDSLAYTGIFDLWGPRDETRQDNTTSLNAWAWALSRGLDMLEREPAVDASKVVVTGCSRLGKAALIAGAFDERFPVVVPVETGGGGVPLAKRNFGETITTEVASFSHWYCRAYDKYAGHEDEMPFDQHLFISCVAPRALLVEGFDEPWFDARGEYLSVKAASPVWKKLGRGGMPDVDFPDDYSTSAIGENLGYVRRDLKHGISVYDWTWMLDFADRNLKENKLNPQGRIVDNSLNVNVQGVDDMAWTWWFGPQVWSVNDIKNKLWWGYTDTQNKVGIAEYDPTSRMYKKTHLKYSDSRDDHNNSIVVVLPDKKVACIYTDGHDAGTHLFVRISKAVECIDEFNEPIAIPFDGTTTYVQYFFMNGKHYLFTRVHKDHYTWAWTCSEDFVNWSEPKEFISATNKRYYIKLQKVTDVDGVIRITAYGHPTQSTDSSIRMGFINFNDGNIYDNDGKTVVTRLGESFYYTDLSVAVAPEEGKVFRLFDVAATPMDEYTVALATFSKKVKTDSEYLIYNEGKLHTLCKGGLPFWMSSVYLGGISFIGPGKVVLSRNDGGLENFGNDHVEIWDYVRGKWKASGTIVSEPVTQMKIRNLRPIVDCNGRYILWQRGSYDHTAHGTSSYELEARIYDLKDGKIIK